MKKTIAATLAGLAFVAGGFFAGTLTASEPAVAEEGAVATGPATGETLGHRDHRRGPAGHMLEAAAEFLDMEPEDLLAALGDGTVLVDLTTDDEGLVAAVVESAMADIDQAVADGKMDPQRAEEIKDGLPERVDAFVTTSHERPDRDGTRADRHVRGFVKEAADVIGIDVSELVAGLEDGKSIVEVAEENGVSEGNLVAHLTNEARERIEVAVNRTR